MAKKYQPTHGKPLATPTVLGDLVLKSFKVYHLWYPESDPKISTRLPKWFASSLLCWVVVQKKSLFHRPPQLEIWSLELSSSLVKGTAESWWFSSLQIGMFGVETLFFFEKCTMYHLVNKEWMLKITSLYMIVTVLLKKWISIYSVHVSLPDVINCTSST